MMLIQAVSFREREKKKEKINGQHKNLYPFPLTQSFAQPFMSDF